MMTRDHPKKQIFNSVFLSMWSIVFRGSVLIHSLDGNKNVSSLGLPSSAVVAKDSALPMQRYEFSYWLGN